MKKIIKLFSICSIMLVMSMFLGINNVEASTGNISITSYTTITVGNSVYVKITGSGSKLFYWQLYVSYDSSKLQLTSGSTTIQGEADDAISGTSSFSQTLRFKTLSTGNTTISVSMGNADMNIDTDFNNVSYSKTSKTLYIVPPVTLSSNNYLTNLTVDGVDLVPVFDKNVLDYSVDLVPDTTNIVVNTVKENGTASVSVSGNVAVIDGVNNIPIVVTAQNGSTRTYNLVATVNEHDPIEIIFDDITYTVVRKKEQLVIPDNYTDTTTIINDEEIIAFNSDITGYLLVGLKDDKGVINLYIKDDNKYTLYNEVVFNKNILYPLEFPKDLIPIGYERTTLEYNEEVLNLYKYKDIKDYYLMYAQNVETGEKNIYSYNSQENTVQIYNSELIDSFVSQIDLYYMILLISLISILGVLLIIIILVLIKKTKKGSTKKISKKEKKANKLQQKEFLKQDKINKKANKNNNSKEKDKEVLGKTKKQEKKQNKIDKKNNKINLKQQKEKFAKEQIRLDKEAKINKKLEKKLKKSKKKVKNNKTNSIEI